MFLNLHFDVLLFIVIDFLRFSLMFCSFGFYLKQLNE